MRPCLKNKNKRIMIITKGENNSKCLFCAGTELNALNVAFLRVFEIATIIFLIFVNEKIELHKSEPIF